MRHVGGSCNGSSGGHYVESKRRGAVAAMSSLSDEGGSVVSDKRTR